MAVSIPVSAWNRFVYDRQDPRRWGEQFYDYMELHLVTSSFDKVWCDGMRRTGSKTGRQMVMVALDHSR